MKTKGLKILASMLIFMLMFTYISIVQEAVAIAVNDLNEVVENTISNGNSIADTNTMPEPQVNNSNGTRTGERNVDFDVYFEKNGDKKYSAKDQIGEENLMYVKVKVNDGYLKSSSLVFDNPNFKITKVEGSSYVSSATENSIVFSQIPSNTEFEVSVNIDALAGDKLQAECMYKYNNAVFTGVYVDNNAKEKAVEGNATVGLMWAKDFSADLDISLANVITYTSGTKKNVAVQFTTKAKLTDNVLPLDSEKIEINLPKIDNKLAEEVYVSAKTTKQINGEEEPISFSTTNYSYDNTDNKLTIGVNNIADANGNISWKKDAFDEYTITAVYDAENLNLDNSTYTASCNAKVELKAANKETRVKELQDKSITISKEITKNIVDFDLKSTSEKISKGQIYANYNAEEKIDTEYSEKIIANITYANMIGKITITEGADNFVNNDGTSNSTIYNGFNCTYIKTISIGKTNFDKIIGEEGKIGIYSNNALIKEIDKETAVNSANEYEVDLSSYDINEIKIETSKPVSEGKLLINIKKAIKGELGYSMNQVNNFTKLETSIACSTLYNEVSGSESDIKTSEIEFIEPQTMAELVIDKPDLSTVVDNKDVKLTAVLRTDSLNCRLYKNPIININFPSYIDNINLKRIDVRFETEGTRLDVIDNAVVVNPDGTKSVVLTLDGTQTEYTIGSVSKGINIILTTDITVNKLTANKQDNITMTYTNNYITEEVNTETAGINIVAPVGVVTVSSISGYEDGQEDITVVSQEPSAVRIKTNAPSRMATLKMSVINNYNNTIDNVSILGRTLFAGNKEILNGVDLTSNIDMPLLSGISASGINSDNMKVYYSENGTATKDLSLAENGWTLTPTNLESVKSYLIVAENSSISTGEEISFNYNVSLPENMKYNKTAMQEYVVYFNNNLESGMIADKQASALFGLTTGSGAVLETTLESSVDENRELPKDEIIVQTLKVKNTGTEIARNVKATVRIPSGLKIIEENENSSTGYSVVAFDGEHEIELGDIAPGNSSNSYILMRVTDISDDTYSAETKIKVTANNIEDDSNIVSVRNKIIKSYFSVVTATESLTSVQREGKEFQQIVSLISQDGKSSIKNTVLEFIIPNEVEYLSSKVVIQQPSEEIDITNEVQQNYDRNTRKLTLNIGTVSALTSKKIELNLKAGILENGTYDKNVLIDAKVYGEDAREQKISMQVIKLAKVGLKVTQTSSITDGTEISASDKFSYTYTVENLSNLQVDKIKITDLLPKELNYTYSTVKYDTGVSDTITTTDENGNPTVTLKLYEYQKVTIQSYVSAKILDEDAQITNKIKVSCDDMDDIYSNSISHTIAKYVKPVRNPDDPNNGGGSSSSSNKRISGSVWLDKNKNGVKDSDEEKVKGVEVWLFNNTTGEIAKNSLGKEIKEVTGEKGVYSFSNIPKGDYSVIFLYDTANYSATTYRKDGVAEESNCDAIDTKITIGGEPRIAGLTEHIILSNENIYNIDLGLVENVKFDLSLNKVVSKITVQDSEGTETTDYNGTKLAKKDLVGRKVNNTTIIVEYTISVRNEGAISGYVKKIADYIPSEMKFSTDLNPDWYISKDREILNSSLANTLINPGETKEVKLVLTKKMTGDSLGVISNTAEIYESYNDLGLEDYDSKVANKATDEDDISGADILITVKTGEYIAFIGLSIGIIAVIGISAIIIKKKVLR